MFNKLLLDLLTFDYIVSIDMLAFHPSLKSKFILSGYYDPYISLTRSGDFYRVSSSNLNSINDWMTLTSKFSATQN